MRRPYAALTTGDVMASEIAGYAPAHRHEDTMYPVLLDSVPESAGISPPPRTHRSNPHIIASPRCPTVRTIAMHHLPPYHRVERTTMHAPGTAPFSTSLTSVPAAPLRPHPPYAIQPTRGTSAVRAPALIPNADAMWYRDASAGKHPPLHCAAHHLDFIGPPPLPPNTQTASIPPLTFAHSISVLPSCTASQIPIPHRVATALPPPLASSTRMGDEQDINVTHEHLLPAQGARTARGGRVAGAMSVTRKEGEGTEGEINVPGKSQQHWILGDRLHESVAHAEGCIEHKTSAEGTPENQIDVFSDVWQRGAQDGLQDGPSNMVQIAVTVLLPVRDVALIRIGCIAIVRRKGDGSGGRTAAEQHLLWEGMSKQDMDKLTGSPRYSFEGASKLRDATEGRQERRPYFAWEVHFHHKEPSRQAVKPIVESRACGEHPIEILANEFVILRNVMVGEVKGIQKRQFCA
ncbi:hypothetical protein B0H14DRAFT_2646683 [Mycena olivaceomarginata]|nr:hypothetical protein B0H14DRAFT_2646683 [Mycena olivaceomarginata]